MSAHEYHFVTHWRVPGTVEEVADILADAPDLPRWWPAVYLDVQEMKPGSLLVQTASIDFQKSSQSLSLQAGREIGGRSR